MHKKSRMELGSPIITVEKESHSVQCIKRAKWSLDEHQQLLTMIARSV